jgi:hypothetical protein
MSAPRRFALCLLMLAGSGGRRLARSEVICGTRTTAAFPTCYPHPVRHSSLWLSGIPLGILLGLAFSIPVSRVAHGAAGAPTISVSEIHEGMKGYGLTVFHGTEPERFDVEVIGVLHNFRPAQDLIIIRTPHPRLNIVKTVAGMSGSPIFFDGRLAGAYAYSLSMFETEPIAGVTPIAPMLSELNRPIPPGFWPAAGDGPLAPKGATDGAHASANFASPFGQTATSFDGPPGTYDLGDHARIMASRMGSRGDGARSYLPVATPLMLSGVGDRTAHFLTSLLEPLGLEPLQTGGGQGPTADAPQHFVDGGALGVELIRGDVSSLAIGTVTHVEGGKLCGFGHPMMNAGDSSLPTSIGRVLWINSSDQRSFKVAETARSLGMMVQDRQSAVVIDETKRPPTFPVSLDIVGVDGVRKPSWHMQVAMEKFMSANFTAASLGSAIEASVSEKRDVTWWLHSKLLVRGHGSIELDDFGVATGGMPDEGELGRVRVVRAVGEILNNPWETARIDGVESTLKVEYARELWRLRGVEVLDEVVDAGKKARIRVHLVPYDGHEIVKEIEVTMPHELAGKDAEVEIVPGWEAVPDVASPENLNELIVNEMHQSLLPRSLVAQVRVPSQGVLYHGHVAPQLPGFALDALRPAHSDNGPEPYVSTLRTVIATERYVEGRDKVRVKVRAVMQ